MGNINPCTSSLVNKSRSEKNVSIFDAGFCYPLVFDMFVPYPDGLYMAFVYIYCILHHGRTVLFPNDCHNTFTAHGFVYKEEMFCCCLMSSREVEPWDI